MGNQTNTIITWLAPALCWPYLREPEQENNQTLFCPKLESPLHSGTLLSPCVSWAPTQRRWEHSCHAASSVLRWEKCLHIYRKITLMRWTYQLCLHKVSHVLAWCPFHAEPAWTQTSTWRGQMSTVLTSSFCILWYECLKKAGARGHQTCARLFCSGVHASPSSCCRIPAKNVVFTEMAVFSPCGQRVNQIK